MITCDKNIGIARDIGELWRNEKGNGTPVIVDMALGDEDEIILTWTEGKNRINLYLPQDRLRRLLEE